MAKIKKNYCINGHVVKLLDELAARLHMPQGEVIENLVISHGVEWYDNLIKSRAQDEETLQYLSNLADFASASSEEVDADDAE